MCRRMFLVATLLAGVLLASHHTWAGGGGQGPFVTNAGGAKIRTFGADGSLLSTPPRTPDPGPVGAAPAAVRTDPGESPPGGGALVPPCPASDTTGAVSRETRGEGFTVDACGRVLFDPDFTGLAPKPAAPTEVAAQVGATIDSFTTTGGSSQTWTPGGKIGLLGSADTYYLSSGYSWQSGAGSFWLTAAALDRVVVSGTTIRYLLVPPPDGVLYRQIDYDLGEHSAQGELGVAGPLVIEATPGSNRAVMRGVAMVVSNDPTWYGEPRFNYYRAIVGSVVPFEITYALASGAWDVGTFDHAFSYSTSGRVDFAHPVSAPLPVELLVVGPTQVLQGTSVQYRATARYENGQTKDVTGRANWAVDPAALASISGGLLGVGRIETPQAQLTIRATYTEGDRTLQGVLPVLCRAQLPEVDVTTWPMFQADSRHTGYRPLSFRPEQFVLRWQRDVVRGVGLNPVTAADGKVFCTLRVYFGTLESLHTLDAKDGTKLWSKTFSNVFSVNPPSYAYGNVYVQTGNHGSDTWLRAYQADNGNPVFQSPHSAQWERYFAPTIDDGKVYVNGGYYGGMYAFDAISGRQLWFLSLPQYDQWTPAVSADQVIAYVGEYTPGLYVARRSSGTLDFTIPDPDFDWNGWSMDLAPVLGGHDDVIAIHDGRLISFDLANRVIRWQLARGFTGQPCVAHEAIYAIDGGRLVVLDEVTHADLWSWQPSRGSLAGTMIVTDSHLFACSADSVFAVDLVTHKRVWSYPASGQLALGNQTLYVAAPTGNLTAIAAPPIASFARADAGRDTTVECASRAGAGTPVRLDGNASQGEGLTYLWSANGVTFDNATSLTPTGLFPVGTTPVVLEVHSDSQVARDTVLVTVTDTRAPNLILSLGPYVLWPPNHRMVAIRASVASDDACDPSPAIRLISVSSSEQDLTAEPGDLPDDIQGAELGTADLEFALRAERTGGGSGRVYTICYESRDAAGNATRLCEAVTVPHDQSGRARLTALAGGPSLTLFGAPSHDVRSIALGSITVGSGDADLLCAAAEGSAYGDVDGDGFEDAVFTLSPGPAGRSIAPESVLYARWRSGRLDHVATLFGDAVLDVPAASPQPAFAAQVVPNPVRACATLRYVLPREGHVRLLVFEVTGRVVARLVDRRESAGAHEATFVDPVRTGSQFYLYRLEWEGQSRAGKFVLVR
jgi:hypothetical protein